MGTVSRTHKNTYIWRDLCTENSFFTTFVGCSCLTKLTISRRYEGRIVKLLWSTSHWWWIIIGLIQCCPQGIVSIGKRSIRCVEFVRHDLSQVEMVVTNELDWFCWDAQCSKRIRNKIIRKNILRKTYQMVHGFVYQWFCRPFVEWGVHVDECTGHCPR